MYEQKDNECDWFTGDQVFHCILIAIVSQQVNPLPLPSFLFVPHLTSKASKEKYTEVLFSAACASVYVYTFILKMHVPKLYIIYFKKTIWLPVT